MTASKPELAPLGPWRVPGAAVEEHAAKRNIPTLDFPQKTKPGTERPETPERPAKFGGFDISQELAYRIRQRALDERCTIRALLLKALAQYGVEVGSDEIFDDGRRRGARGGGR